MQLYVSLHLYKRRTNRKSLKLFLAMLNPKQRKSISIQNFSSHSASICCPPSPIQEEKSLRRHPSKSEEKTNKSERFKRAISFPIPKSHVIKRSSYKTRSSSLPVRFHPIVSNLDDDVASLKTWSSSRPPSDTWLSDGVGLISLVLTSLSDLLHHPLALDPLRKSPVTDSFSDDMIRLADMYSSFRTCLLNLLHLLSETQAALRRSDASRLSSAVRAQRRATRGIMQLADAVQTAAKTPPPLLIDAPEISPDQSGVAMLPTSICNSAKALATASAVVFQGLAKRSDDSTVSIATTMVGIVDYSNCKGNVVRIWWVVDLLRWKLRAKRKLGAMNQNHSMKNGLVLEGKTERKMEEEKVRKMAMARLDELEESIRAMEISCEKIYRGFVNARVSLLNFLTPS